LLDIKSHSLDGKLPPATRVILRSDLHRWSIFQVLHKEIS
jgi:hypothetical protein